MRALVWNNAGEWKFRGPRRSGGDAHGRPLWATNPYRLSCCVLPSPGAHWWYLGERNVRQLIGLVPALGLALALGACVTNAPPTQKLSAGEWRVEGRTDRVADQPSVTAVNITRSRNARVHPFELQLASLQLLCFDNAPVVRFQFSHNVGSNRNSRLSYRFDQNPGRDVEVRILRDQKTIVIEDPDNVLRFADEMRNAGNLIVQVHSLTASMSSADFKVAGAPAVIDAAYAGCPLPNTPKPRVS